MSVVRNVFHLKFGKAREALPVFVESGSRDIFTVVA